MDTAQARRFYQDYLDTIYHQGRIEELGRFFTDDIVPHPSLPGGVTGLGAMKAAVASWRGALSSMHITVEGFVAHGDFLAPRLLTTAVHTGDFMGIPASGRRLSLIHI